MLPDSVAGGLVALVLVASGLIVAAKRIRGFMIGGIPSSIERLCKDVRRLDGWQSDQEAGMATLTSAIAGIDKRLEKLDGKNDRAHVKMYDRLDSLGNRLTAVEVKVEALAKD